MYVIVRETKKKKKLENFCLALAIEVSQPSLSKGAIAHSTTSAPWSSKKGSYQCAHRDLPVRTRVISVKCFIWNKPFSAMHQYIYTWLSPGPPLYPRRIPLVQGSRNDEGAHLFHTPTEKKIHAVQCSRQIYNPMKCNTLTVYKIQYDEKKIPSVSNFSLF